MNPLQQFHTFGQSPYPDNLRRKLIGGGELQRLIEGGVRGLTSNSAIVEVAITQRAEGVGKFVEPFGSLMATLAKARDEAAAAVAPRAD